MTTASILSAVSMALTTALALLRGIEAYQSGLGPLNVNRAPGAAAGAAPGEHPPV